MDHFEPPHLVKPPKDLMANNFESNVQTVSSWLGEIQALDPDQHVLAFTRAIASGFQDFSVGTFSKLHDNVVYA